MVALWHRSLHHSIHRRHLSLVVPPETSTSPLGLRVRLDELRWRGDANNFPMRRTVV